MDILKKYTFIILLILIALLTALSYRKMLLPPYLIFSDSAKFADIARNIVLDRGYTTNFSFFDIKAINNFKGEYFLVAYPPIFPFMIAILFKLFGVTDNIVILISILFYVLSAVFVYLIGNNLFGKHVGFLSSLCFIFDSPMLDYATSGASESLFIFEIIAAAYFFLVRRRYYVIMGFIALLLSYLTKSSAIIYVIPLLIFLTAFTRNNFREVVKTALLIIIVLILLGIITLIIPSNPLIYSPFSTFVEILTGFSPDASSTTILRGGRVMGLPNINFLVSKLFYNLYNYYKLLPQIFSPYLITLYLMSLLRIKGEIKERYFRITIVTMLLMTLISAAATLPNFRYLHPMVPFVYLLSVEMIVWLVGNLFKMNKKVFILSLVLTLFFSGQIFGRIFLDSRFLRSRVNPDKPPVYVVLSEILKQNSRPNDLIVTNLDTWGSWYGERKTIWFPMSPLQLIPTQGQKLKIDAIFITSYKNFDENYALGSEWGRILENPNKIEDKFINVNFKLAATFTVNSNDTREKEGASAILLVRK